MQSRNLAARAGRWSAEHRKTAILGWILFVVLAVVVAVFAVRRTGRTIVASVLSLSGAGAIAAALLGSGDTEALEASAAEATGLTHAAVAGVSHTGWPWVSSLGGLLLLFAGLLALSYGRQWPAMSGRYERAARRGGAGVLVHRRRGGLPPHPRRTAGRAPGGAPAGRPRPRPRRPRPPAAARPDGRA